MKHAEMLELIQRTHARFDARDARAARQIAAAEQEPLFGNVRVGANATDEFRQSLNGGL